MDLQVQPLVSVLTPVYNGEKYLTDCIESVLAQTYQNWEYTIINNCSTDHSLEIIQSYARQDARIRICNNQEFVDVIRNHNIAFRQISPESKYCKMVHADDWLFPECIDRMVEVAEANPSVCIVGSYGLQGDKVACDGLPYPSTVISGREICRLNLLRKAYVFWPTSLLIRSDLIRSREEYYKPYLHADVEACYEHLQKADFGFVHQVLTYIRKHEESVTSSTAMQFNSIILANLELLIKYGPFYLSSEEYKERFGQQIDEYYRFLIRNFFPRKDKRQFWNYHRKNGFGKLSLPLNMRRFSGAFVKEVLRFVYHQLAE